MYALVDYFTFIIRKVYSILDVRIFSDFPVTYIQMIISCIILGFVFKFIFSGFKETELQFNSINSQINSQVSKQISNLARKKDINKGYKPKHSKE